MDWDWGIIVKYFESNTHMERYHIDITTKEGRHEFYKSALWEYNEDPSRVGLCPLFGDMLEIGHRAIIPQLPELVVVQPKSIKLWGYWWATWPLWYARFLRKRVLKKLIKMTE